MTKEQTAEWFLSKATGDDCLFSEYAPGATGWVEIAFAGRMIGLHRLVYEVMVGPIPTGLVVDHTCHDPKVCEGGTFCPHRACINPDHLAAVTHAHNTSAERSCRDRPDVCGKGHPFTPENTYTDKRGSRHCLTCHNGGQRERRAAAKTESGWVDKRFRRGGKCRNDHVIAEVGVTLTGKCAECARARNREYKKRFKAA
jgi:hypothetical protein